MQGQRFSFRRAASSLTQSLAVGAFVAAGLNVAGAVSGGAAAQDTAPEMVASDAPDTIESILTTLDGATASAPSATQGADPLRNDAPAMWRLADADTEIYLFGTFHILPPGVNWRTETYDAAMTASAITMVEADLSAPNKDQHMLELLSEYGYNPAGVTLTDTIGVLRAQRLKEVAARFGMQGDLLEAQRPWLALVTLSALALKEAGFDELNGVETLVLQRATMEGDSFDYFETLEDQIVTLASLGDEDMLANFDATMAQFDDFQVYTQIMLDAWRTGDLEALDTSVLGELRRDSPKAFDALIVSRNRKWMTRVIDLMEGDGSYFIAVGAGHLVGEDSLVDLLVERGYAVDRIQ
ncbi:MAG: TraB/GumN family protein [Pseudomonadota bacterium]